MDMAEYSSDGAYAVAGRLGTPRARIEVLDNGWFMRSFTA
jgi:hypothetical protein